MFEMRESAHANHGDQGIPRIISNRRNNLQSIYIGEADFEENYVWRVILNFIDRTRACMGDLGLKACEFKLLP